MIQSWQTLLLLISVPLLILSILSFLGHLIRLLPYVFLIVFGFGGISVILDATTRDTLLGTIELIIGTVFTIISVVNLYLVISSHKHDLAVLQSRRPFTPIRNIVLDKIEKPRFNNPNTGRSNIGQSSIAKSSTKQNKLSKKAKTKQLASLSPKPSKRSPQF